MGEGEPSASGRLSSGPLGGRGTLAPSAGLRIIDSVYFHGYSYYDAPAQANGYFLFGFLRLCQTLSTRHIRKPGSPREDPFPAWTLQWRVPVFLRTVMSLQGTFWKLDRSASHLGSRVEFINRHLRTAGLAFTPELLDALSDAAIFLDLLLFYLRITADIVAKIVPFLYPNRPQIATRSFRDHVAWYRKSPDFDPEYCSILEASIGWFDLLAGKRPKGLRDVLAHYPGEYQFGWRGDAAADPVEFKATMISELGSASEDVIPDLKAIARGLFLYLDKAFVHFSTLIRSQLSQDFLLPDRAVAHFFEFEDPMPSLWLYPTVEEGAPPTA